MPTSLELTDAESSMATGNDYGLAPLRATIGSFGPWSVGFSSQGLAVDPFSGTMRLFLGGDLLGSTFRTVVGGRGV